MLSPHKWHHWLPSLKFLYNSAYHLALNTTPFRVYMAWIQSSWMFRLFFLHLFQKLMSGYNNMLIWTLSFRTNCLDRTKVQGDKGRHEQHLKIHNLMYKWQLLTRVIRNWPSNTFGPFLILQRVGYVSYKLQMLESSKFILLCCPSLKKNCTTYFRGMVGSPYRIDTDHMAQPATILGWRLVHKDSGMSMQVLMHWKDLPAKWAT